LARLAHPIERPQQQCVHDAEDRSVRADSKREGEHRNEREHGILPQRAEPEPQILHDLVLPPLTLQPECIPERPGASLQEIPLVPPIKPIPIAEQLLAISQFRLPFLPPVRA